MAFKFDESFCFTISTNDIIAIIIEERTKRSLPKNICDKINLGMMLNQQAENLSAANPRNSVFSIFRKSREISYPLQPTERNRSANTLRPMADILLTETCT